jgi:hypothetical protein
MSDARYMVSCLVSWAIIICVLAIPISLVIWIVAAFFSPRIGSRIEKHPVILALWFISAAVVMFMIIYPMQTHPDRAKSTRANSLGMDLAIGFRAYYTEYGRYPLQTASTEDHAYAADYKPLIDILTGKASNTNENPRRLVFIEINKRDLNAAGVFVDPWNNPFNIVADWDGNGEVRVGTTNLHVGVAVWSSGPNRKNEFGRGDDIHSW